MNEPQQPIPVLIMLQRYSKEVEFKCAWALKFIFSFVHDFMKLFFRLGLELQRFSGVIIILHKCNVNLRAELVFLEKSLKCFCDGALLVKWFRYSETLALVAMATDLTSDHGHSLHVSPHFLSLLLQMSKISEKKKICFIACFIDNFDFWNSTLISELLLKTAVLHPLKQMQQILKAITDALTCSPRHAVIKYGKCYQDIFHNLSNTDNYIVAESFFSLKYG